jgi:LysM repeat protein
MPDNAGRSPLRLLAPIALALFAVAFVGVVATSGGGDDGGGGEQPTTRERSQTSTTERTETATERQPASYTVKTGDTLGGIAEKTGLTVERLQELNPELDPQALVAGQRIKLRE